MRSPRYAFVWPAMVAALTCAAQPDASTPMLLQIPQEVAGHAAARAEGDASSPPPILVLEDLELGSGEGLTLQVLGPPDPETGERPVLAVSATVGSPQPVPETPLERMTLVVPLNDAASQLLAGKEEVELTLRVLNSPGRPALRMERAYFRTTSGKQE